MSLTAPPTTEFSSPVLEASGHAYVQLTGAGQSVTWTNNTGQNITTVNLRYSIPDAPNGGGISSTIDLYVNGIFRQAINLNSMQTWVYENSSNYNSMSQTPSSGSPRVFWDEAPTFVSGAAIAPGSTITLEKDSANNASFYYIDCIDLEAPTPLSQPTNTLSITDYGAVANNTSVDNTTAIQNCFNAAQSQGKAVWIPQGIFYISSGAILYPTNITIEGAGPWYSTICEIAPPSQWENSFIFQPVSSSFQNLCIDSTTTGTGATTASGKNMSLPSGNNWSFTNVWARHLMLTWADGNNITIQHCRVNNSYGDGINLNNVGGAPCNNLTVQNNFIRGCGDDSIAINDSSSSQPTMSNITISNNTTLANWGGKGVALYGGTNILVQNNYIADTARYTGLGLGYFEIVNSIQGALIQNNMVVRCGGNGFMQQQAAVDIGTEPPSFYTSNNIPVQSVSNMVVTGNTVSSPVFGAVDIHTCSDMVLQNNVMSSPSLYGITVDPTALGDGIIQGNTLANPAAGYAQFFDDASGYAITPVNKELSAPIAAASYNTMSSVQTENCAEGGLDVGYIGNGSYTAYNNIDLTDVISFSARVASPGGGGTITLHLDSPTGTAIGTCTVPNTSGWQTWATQTCNLSGANGYHNLYLVYSGGFNITWFALQKGIGITRASSYNSLSSAQTETCVEGGLDVTNSANGSYTAYNNVNLNGMASFQVRAANSGASASIAIHLDSPTGTLIGTCTVPTTGGSQTWTTQACTLIGASGYHNVYLVYSGGFGVEWFAFQGVANGTEASSYNTMSSVQTENCAEGGLDVGYIGNGSYTAYNSVDLNDVTSFSARVASPGGGGTIAIHLDGPTGTVIGTCTVPSTGGWQTWTTQTCNVSGATGYHNIYLVYSGGFNIEWFAFQGQGIRTESGSYNSVSGTQSLEACSEGGQDLGGIASGAYAVYNDVNLTGATSFATRTASASTGGTIALHLDSPTGTLIGTCTVPATGGSQTYVTTTCSISGATGYHNVYLVFTQGGFSLEWFSFQGQFVAIAASSYASVSGGEWLETCSEGGQDMGGISNGTYAVFNNVNLNSTSTFVVREASDNTSGGTIAIHLDSPTGPLIGTCTCPFTGDWQMYSSQTCTINGASGTHNIYLVFTQGGFNLEWFAFF